MTGFTTRVELHGADGNDYKSLHTEMQAEGFTQMIVSDKGVRYHLPTAEYNYEGRVTRAEVIEKAKAAATRVKKNYAVLVTESAGRTWHGLQTV